MQKRKKEKKGKGERRKENLCKIYTFKRGSRELLMFQFWFGNDSN